MEVINMLESNANVVTVKEAANMLGISRARAYKLVYEGKLASLKMAGTVLVVKSSVLQRQELQLRGKL
jgi:excisionase family DNA binding protein